MWQKYSGKSGTDKQKINTVVKWKDQKRLSQGSEEVTQGNSQVKLTFSLKLMCFTVLLVLYLLIVYKQFYILNI